MTLALHQPSVRRCQEQIDSAEFSEWMAYHALDPFGSEREDLRAAMIQATSVNKWIPADKQPVPVSQFMPRFDAPTIDPEEVWDKVNSVMRIFGGS